MGEVLDVDAICGGYNLMFAFASAIEVFKEIKNEIQNK
jgi:predicted flavoprotein YhiN